MRKKYQKKSAAPIYKEGGQTKQEWISNKIRLLEHENKGRSHEQNIAIAFSMAEDKFQQGGSYNYSKTGNVNISNQDVNKINQGTGIQFTPEFATSYFSTQNAPASQPTPTQKPIVDITMGMGDARKVWNVRPENLVGQEPQEGRDYYLVPPKKWNDFQHSPAYYEYSNKSIPQNSQIAAEFKEGGELPQYQNAGWSGLGSIQNAWDNRPQFLRELPRNEASRRIEQEKSSQNIYPGLAPQNQNLFFQQQPTAQQWATQPAPAQAAPVPQATAVKPPVVATPTNDASQLASKAPETLTDEEKMQVLGDYNKLRKEGKYPYFAELDSPEKALGMSYPTQTPQEHAARLQGAMLTPEGEAIAATAANTQPQTQAEKDFAKKVAAETTNKPQPFQFINPGGISIETAANIFGQGLANKNPFDIITGGLKVATGLGRNILAPYASNVASNRVNARAAEDMRDSITRTGQSQTLSDQGWNEGLGYYQEGGDVQQGNPQEQMLMQVAQALQQGAAPEEVLQQLISSGLSEEEATQLIQMVMQEMQTQAPPAEEQPMMQNGGTLDTLKGKRIVDYKLNPSTGNYTVTYED